jgi:hypothetical protein
MSESTQTIEERIAESKEAMESWKELLPFGKMKDGDNSFIVEPTIPIQKVKGKFGDQNLYTGTLNGEKVKLSLPMSVEIPVLKGLQEKVSSFSINKTGSGMKTRYIVKRMKRGSVS